MFPVIRWGNLQSPANWLDPVQVTVLIDISVYYFRRRSSSAWAKKALAVFKISLARRNSLTSRSRSLIRFCSSLVTPGRTPASISARLTQPTRVDGAHPNFGPIEALAAHNDLYSWRFS